MVYFCQFYESLNIIVSNELYMFFNENFWHFHLLNISKIAAVNRHVGGPETSEVAAMMSTGMRTFFQSGVQKNLRSLYQSFVPQKFSSAHVCKRV